MPLGDVIFVKNGLVWDGVSDGPEFLDILVRDGVVVSVKPRGEIEAPVGAAVVDASGQTVLPAFTDAHVHLSGCVQAGMAVDLSGCRSADELGEALKRRAAELEAGEWVYGINFDETVWEDSSLPDRFFLDGVSTAHPVLIVRRCIHTRIVNSLALDISGSHAFGGCQDELLAPRGAGGSLCGILRESAGAAVCAKFQRDTMSDLCAVSQEMEKFLDVGITQIHVISSEGLGSAESYKMFQDMRRDGLLKARVVLYFDKMPNVPTASGLGDGWLSFGGFKMFLDGSLGAASAALRRNYDNFEGSGLLLLSDDEVYRRLVETAVMDVQPMVHAIGDEALDQLLDAVEAVLEEGLGWSLPVKISHAELCHPEQIERMAKLPVVLDMQPHQIYSDAQMLPKRIGDRIKVAFVLDELLGAGIPIVSSSDAPIEPINPMASVWAMMARTPDGDGGRFIPGEPLALAEALRMYTCVPAWAIGQGDVRGKIAVGYQADFVFYEGNLWELSVEAFRDLRPVRTMIL